MERRDKYTLLIRNARRYDGSRVDIHIEDGIIVKVGENVTAEADRVLDACGKYVIPGMYNMHTHAAMTLFRGYRDDMKLFEWLQQIWAVEAHLDDEAIYWGTRLACLEMLRSGTVCFVDMYWHPDVTAQAVKDSGMRAVLTSCLLDAGNEKTKVNDRLKCEKAYADSLKWPDTVRFGVAVHAPYTVCRENIRWAADFARERNLLLNIHVSETDKENEDCMAQYGKSPVKMLDEMGFFGEDVILAHGLWLDDEDVEILGRNRVTVAHNVNSNLKLASGHAFRYEELKRAGANVTLGTDGCSSSNNLDVLEAMKTASLLQKGWRRDPESLPLGELMDMATVNGAVGCRVKGGVLAEGYAADLALVDVHSPAFVPNLNFLSNLVYAADSSCIDTVICDGKVVMEGRKVKDEDEILEKGAENAARLIAKVH